MLFLHWYHVGSFHAENTKYDFRNYTKLSDRIKSNGEWPDEGFDNFFIIHKE